jgi:hypothetical protein
MLAKQFFKWSPFAIALAADCVLFINLCSLIFRCGCRPLWAGAAMACNIHMAGMKHCPFCAHGESGQGIVMAAIIIPQLIVAIRAPWTWYLRFFAMLAIFPIAETIAALLFGWSDGYWNH